MAISSQIHERVVAVAPEHSERMRLRWGGVWAGFLVACGVLLLLSVLGLAVGITAVGDDGSVDGGNLGMGAAIWSGLALLIALFIGGMVATRSSAVADRASGMIEGVLVWVLSILAIIWMAGSGIGLLASSASGVLGGVTRTAAAAATNVDVAGLTSGDAQQIVQRLNDPQVVRIVSAATGTSQEEAKRTLDGIAQRVQAARDDPARAAAEARQGLQQIADQAQRRVGEAAQQAQPAASATLWTTFAALVLALVAAVVGAMTGLRQVQRRLGMTGAAA